MQIPPKHRGRSWAGTVVDVRELLDGQIMVFHDDQLIASETTNETHFQLVPRMGPGDQQRKGRARPTVPATPKGSAQPNQRERQPSNQAWSRQIHADITLQRLAKEREG